MKNYFYKLLSIFTLLMTSSCLVNLGEHYIEDKYNNPVIEEVSELFDNDGNNNINFFTNETRYIAPRGYSLWTILDDEPTEYTSRTIEINKISGVSIAAGFGGVYCQFVDPEFGLTFLLFMINLDGEYCIGEVINGKVFNYLVEWTFTKNLNRGLNQINLLSLDYESSENKFHVSINGEEEITFRDDEAPFHKSGKQGYIVTISPIDEFPEVPVEVRFTEK